MGLYTVSKPDIKVLTHPYSPYHEINGFEQMGKFKPVTNDPGPKGLGELTPADLTGPILRSQPIIPGQTPSANPVAPTTITYAPGSPGAEQVQRTYDAMARGYDKAFGSIPNEVLAKSSYATTYGKSERPGQSSSIYGYREGDMETFDRQPSISSRGRIRFKSKRYLEDDFQDGLSSDGLSGFSLKKAFKKVGSKVSQAYKVVIHNPGRAVKRVGAVVAGAVVGAGAGFVTGGVPGAFAGAGAGAVKSFSDVTKTSKANYNTRSVYQSAAWGAAAGAVTGIANRGITAASNAQKARSAAEAAKVGYGAAGSTAAGAGTYGAAVPGIGSGIFAAIGSTGKALLPYGGLTPWFLPRPGEGGPGQGEGGVTNVFDPSTGGYVPSTGGVGIGTPSGAVGAGGSEYSEGGGENLIPTTGAADEAGTGLPDVVKKNAVPLLAGVVILGYIASIKPKMRRYRRAA